MMSCGTCCVFYTNMCSFLVLSPFTLFSTATKPAARRRRTLWRVALQICTHCFCSCCRLFEATFICRFLKVTLQLRSMLHCSQVFMWSIGNYDSLIMVATKSLFIYGWKKQTFHGNWWSVRVWEFAETFCREYVNNWHRLVWYLICHDADIELKTLGVVRIKILLLHASVKLMPAIVHPSKTLAKITRKVGKLSKCSVVNIISIIWIVQFGKRRQ